MTRAILDAKQIDPSISNRIGGKHLDTVLEVQKAVLEHSVVVVGMAQNPFCRKARQLLDKQGLSYCDLSYGSYLGQWQQRLSLKLWSGWPTLPMVFVQGVLIGGANELQALSDSGELSKRISEQA